LRSVVCPKDPKKKREMLEMGNGKMAEKAK
jgi:hypothetical protein